jgi:uncharacterized protein (TIGR00251 family)
LIRFRDIDGKLSFAVSVVPRASRSELVGEHNGTLRIRIAAPPVDGAANAELIRLLSKTFRVPRKNIEISAGERSKTKAVTVFGGDSEILKQFS